ncbi:hypothetical protein EGJ52_21850 [Pseudomonas luteola]|nr:hypothetical protein EGJ52_21850 [Pseudomonas luteola]
MRLLAYSASAKVICFMEKLGWRDRRISPDSGSLFQTFLRAGMSGIQLQNTELQINLKFMIKRI